MNVFSKSAKTRRSKLLWKLLGLVAVCIVLLVGINLLWQGRDPYLTVPEDEQNTLFEGKTRRAMTPTEIAQANYLRWELDYLTKVWTWLMEHHHRSFTPPKLVFFSNSIAMTCDNGGGYATQEKQQRATQTVTTFYCPANKTLYVDVSVDTLFQEYSTATARFGRIYVLAWAIGHHVQHQQGILGRLAKQQQQLSKPRQKLLEDRRLLQLDCYAGLWLHFRRQVADNKNIYWPVADGLHVVREVYGRVENQIATGALQRTWQPGNFRHSTQSQQERWFTVGNQKGVEHACDTYTNLKPAR